MSLAGKTLFITGGSRGIGRAIALRAAADGANVAIAAKTVDPHPRLPGTIISVAGEVAQAGGRGLPLQVDIRDDETVAAAVQKTVDTFGGIDIVVNNASAIALKGTEALSMKRFDLMFDINARGSFLVTKLCLPHLKKAANPHVLNLSPPLNMEARWFKDHAPYTLAKYAMSAWVLGMAEEFRSQGIAFNALWPRTAVATAAIANMPGGDFLVKASRKPEVMSDAAWYILTANSRETTGNFFVDDDVLAAHGITDLEPYAVSPGTDLVPDFFL